MRIYRFCKLFFNHQRCHRRLCIFFDDLRDDFLFKSSGAYTVSCNSGAITLSFAVSVI